MESLKHFKNKELNNQFLKSIEGGSTGQGAIIESSLRLLGEPKVYASGAFIDDEGTPDDYWTDNDGDMKLSPGDTMCFN